MLPPDIDAALTEIAWCLDQAHMDGCAGQVLVGLDPRTFEAILAQAQAALAVAERQAAAARESISLTSKKCRRRLHAGPGRHRPG